MAVLCIFAHQDDEIAMAWRISRLTGNGRDVVCFFLTSGTKDRGDSSVRDNESRAVLEKLGVSRDRVFFIGSEHGISDGSLLRNVERAYVLLEQISRPFSIDEILCLSWEGGHHDHDASHLIALALAKERNVLARIHAFPLYNGEGTLGGLCRVMSPIGSAAVETRRVPLNEALRVASLCFEYRSQFRTWLGLFPGVFLKLVVMRQEISGTTAPEKVRQPPHAGRLFYERRYGVTYEEFRDATDDFVRRRI